MNISKISVLEKIPDQFEPAAVIPVPENSQAVVFHVVTKAFESQRHGCTTHKDVWFPCPAPIVFRERPNGLQMVVIVNSEVINLPPAAGEELLIEFAVVGQPGSGILR